ncbi:MAG: hypothetical protein IJ009_05685 [Clostridia bacterium]|nr:hypothetical protein [Clostridia bacterium]
MKSPLRALLAVRLRALFAGMFTVRSNKKKNVGKKPSVLLIILLSVLLLYVGVVFAILFGSLLFMLMLSLRAAGQDLSFYFAAAAALTVLLCVFGSVFATQSELYNAKDNELLLAMPVSPSQILISRMVMLAIINYGLSLVVIVPALLIYLLSGVSSPLGIVAFCVFFLLLPLMSLAISCLLGWLLALISSRMRHKNIVSLVLSVAFLVLYIGGMGAFSSMMETIDPETLDIMPIVSAITPYLLVFNWLGQAMCGNILSGALFLVFCAAVCGLTMIFLSRSYIRIVTTNRGGVRVKYREKSVKQSSPLWALMKKELRHFTSSAAYMLNEGLGLVFAPILAGILLFKRDEMLGFFELEGTAPEELAFLTEMLPVLIAGMLCFLASMVIISAPSVSLEGKNVWITQSMPVPSDKPLLAKVYTHILIATPFYFLASLFAVIAIRPDFLSGVMLFLLPFLSNVFCAYLGVFFNILFPKLDWVNEAAAVKSGAAVLLTMLGMMVLEILEIVGMILLFLLGVPSFLCMLIPCAILFGASCGLRAYLRRGGARRFANL